jgi:trimeric autotransporter adhesin
VDAATALLNDDYGNAGDDEDDGGGGLEREALALIAEAQRAEQQRVELVAAQRRDREARRQSACAVAVQAAARGWLTRRRVGLADAINARRLEVAQLTVRARDAAAQIVAQSTADGSASSATAYTAADDVALADGALRRLYRESVRAEVDALRAEHAQQQQAAAEQARRVAAAAAQAAADAAARAAAAAAAATALERRRMAAADADSTAANAHWREGEAAAARAAEQQRHALAREWQGMLCEDIGSRRTQPAMDAAAATDRHYVFPARTTAPGGRGGVTTQTPPSRRNTASVQAAATHAVTQLAALWRGHRTRTDAANPLVAHRARIAAAAAALAVRLQALWRGHRLRARLREVLETVCFVDADDYAYDAVDAGAFLGGGAVERLLRALREEGVTHAASSGASRAEGESVAASTAAVAPVIEAPLPAGVAVQSVAAVAPDAAPECAAAVEARRYAAAVEAVDTWLSSAAAAAAGDCASAGGDDDAAVDSDDDGCDEAATLADSASVTAWTDDARGSQRSAGSQLTSSASTPQSAASRASLATNDGSGPTGAAAAAVPTRTGGGAARTDGVMREWGIASAQTAALVLLRSQRLTRGGGSARASRIVVGSTGGATVPPSTPPPYQLHPAAELPRTARETFAARPRGRGRHLAWAAHQH